MDLFTLHMSITYYIYNNGDLHPVIFVQDLKLNYLSGLNMLYFTSEIALSAASTFSKVINPRLKKTEINLNKHLHVKHTFFQFP